MFFLSLVPGCAPAVPGWLGGDIARVRLGGIIVDRIDGHALAVRHTLALWALAGGVGRSGDIARVRLGGIIVDRIDGHALAVRHTLALWALAGGVGRSGDVARVRLAGIVIDAWPCLT